MVFKMIVVLVFGGGSCVEIADRSASVGLRVDNEASGEFSLTMTAINRLSSGECTKLGKVQIE